MLEKRIEEVEQNLKGERNEKSRALAIVKTKIDEAKLWLLVAEGKIDLDKLDKIEK